MSHSVAADRLSRLPEKADMVLKADVRKSDRTRERRLVLAAVLEDALLLMKIARLKQQAAFLGKDPRTLRRWFDGIEPIPWEELLLVPALQWPLCEALLASCQRDLVEIETTMRQRHTLRKAG